ncbi:MAG: hypothetical protein ACYDHX_13865 [Methanothrix sp.]
MSIFYKKRSFKQARSLRASASFLAAFAPPGPGAGGHLRDLPAFAGGGGGGAGEMR